MSRFFKGASDSESESESDYSEEEAPVQATRATRAESSDEEDEVVKRVVKSQKDKLVDEFQKHVTSIKAHLKANDWPSLQDDFDKVHKSAQKIGKQETPREFYKALVLIEDQIKKVTESQELLKKLGTINTKVFNALKQKIKKANKPFEEAIKIYRAKPDVEKKDDQGDEEEDEEEEEEEEEGSEEEEESEEDKKPSKGKAPAKAPAKGAKETSTAAKAAAPSKAPAPSKDAPSGLSKWLKKPSTKDESESEDSDDVFDNLDEDEDEEDEDEDKGDKEKDSDESDGSDSGRNVYKGTETNKANKWMKVESSKGDKDKDKEKDKEKEKEKKGKAPKIVKIKEAGAPVVVEEKEKKELTVEQVDKRLTELLANRGKKGTDRFEQTTQLEALSVHAKNDTQLLAILMNLVSAQFDVTLNSTSYMPVNIWRSAYKNLQKIMAVLNKNPTIKLVEDETDKEFTEDTENVVSVGGGNLVAFVERLDDEFIKSLQSIDPHTTEYVSRLSDEQNFLEIAEAIQIFYERRTVNLKRAVRVASRRLEHLYYKTERDTLALARYASITQAREAAAKGVQTPEISLSAITVDKTQIHKLATMVYAYGDERLRARAMLCHIYYSAIHDKFYEARDMMLMSHLQESVLLMDIPTQILFNRTMVQLGLCAFRSGLIVEAHGCLADLYSQNRIKELLAQGLSSMKYQEKSAEQEKLEKKRLVPYHMHINLELLECVHLISAMLLEVPNMAANAFDPKKRVISKNFRRLLDFFDRQVFTGPPENTRDYVAAAAKALSNGDWKTSEKLLLGLKAWNLLPNPDGVKQMIRKKLQEEGLRTYLYSFSRFYDSLSLAELARLFELSENTVHSIVSKMIINEELHATWDQPTGSVVMYKAEASRLQYLALAFAEKAAQFVENNEKLLEGPSTGRGDKGYSQNAKSTGGMGWVQRYSGGGQKQGFINRDNRRTQKPQGRGSGANSRGGGEGEFQTAGRRGGYQREHREPREPREPREGGYQREPREHREGGYQREPREGGYQREPREHREGGYQREPREGGYQREPREHREGGYQRERNFNANQSTVSVSEGR